MNAKKNNIKKRMGIWAAIVAVILMIPFVFRAPWTFMDFVLAGVVLLGAASLYEFATKNMGSTKYKILAAVVIFGLLVLVQAWAAAGPD